MNARSPSLLDSRFSLAWCMSKRYIPILFAFTLYRAHVLLLKFQVANILLISNKISINKNKQIYFFYFFFIFLYWYFTLPHGSGDWGAISCLRKLSYSVLTFTQKASLEHYPDWLSLCFSIKANTKNYFITPCSWNIPLRISTERSTCSLVCVAIRA